MLEPIATTDSTARPRCGARFVPPFQNGDTMDQPTFHRLYEGTPDGFKAELIGGIVFMASPVRVFHGLPHGNLATWLGVYSARTTGVRMFIDTSAILGEESEPQPDLALAIKQEAGGQTTQGVDGYITGAPELVVEIAASTAAIDLHAKKRDYDLSGVREYYVAVEPSRTIRRFIRGRSGLVERASDADGIIRCKAFPGLWLDPTTAFDDSPAGVLQTLDGGLASAEHTKFAAKLRAKLGKKAR